MFSDVNFDTDNYNEYIRGERAVLDLMPHQVNAHNNCDVYFDNNKKRESLSYLFNHLPRSGKSITCSNIMANQYEAGFTSVYFSIEMTGYETLERNMSILAGVNH